MSKKGPEPTASPIEGAILIGVELVGEHNLFSREDSLNELTQLAETAGIKVLGHITQHLKRPNPKTFIGSGKVEEVKSIVGETGADLVLFDEELSPRHQRELEQIFDPDVRVIDRTALILDIFSQHAHTREGALQVELAQYEYRLPRLTRAWTHLARQAGGGGGRAGGIGGVGLRGPGETQLEVDRRDIHRKIDYLKNELEKVRAHRSRHRSKRKGSGIPVVALVGYTNAGKSTLINQLSGANVYVANQLFATLDPTTRRVELPGGNLALFTDTVGFIQKLPTSLIAAFRATLEEIADADLLMHIIDITHPNVIAQAEAVHQTLVEIQADHVPVLTVLNKVDCLSDPDRASQSLVGLKSAVAISALTGVGIHDLLKVVSCQLFEKFTPITVRLPYQEGGLIAIFHEQGLVKQIEHSRNYVVIKGSLPGRLLAKYTPFLEKDKKEIVEEINKPNDS
jgi:GTP-binding protein HflX